MIILLRLLTKRYVKNKHISFSIIKKEVIVNTQLLNFYLEESLNKGLINNKKVISLTNHLIEIDKMTRGWLNCEKGS